MVCHSAKRERLKKKGKKRNAIFQSNRNGALYTDQFIQQLEFALDNMENIRSLSDPFDVFHAYFHQFYTGHRKKHNTFSNKNSSEYARIKYPDMKSQIELYNSVMSLIYPYPKGKSGSIME